MPRATPDDAPATAPAHPTLPHPTLEETAALAGTWHAGQIDKAGRPYIHHLMRVSAHLARLFPAASLAERHAAWLHDVLEDTSITADDLAAYGYAPAVVRIVQALTKPADRGLTYAGWIDALATSGDVSAIRVKLADLNDNVDPTRLAALPEDRAVSLRGRYARAIERLAAALVEAQADTTDDAPAPLDHVPLTLRLAPAEVATLAWAAERAERTTDAFAVEAALSAARRLLAREPSR